MAARSLTALCFGLALLGANAQTSDEKAPDEKAYAAANKITDGEPKIAALEKLKKDFPDSLYVSAADRQILSTLIETMPEQTGRIRKAAKTMYARAKADRGSTSTRIADELLEGNLLLKDAESYARKGVDALRENAWTAERRKSYARRKQKIPQPEQLAGSFAEARAGRVATLGLVELKLGNTAEARKLLEECYAVDPSMVTVSAALGELASKAGDDGKAMDYLISARLTGRAPSTANQALEALYRKGHEGSLDGLEAMLDAEYRRRLPNPIHMDAYRPTDKRTGRVVLAEVFTGSGCSPCAGADVAFDAAMERYSRKDLAVVMYHVHVPAPDPMTTAVGTARYESYYGKKGVPTFAIDGKRTSGGSSRAEAASVFERFQKDLEADLEASPEAQVKVAAALNGGTVKVSATVDEVKSDSKELKVRIVLVEKEIRYLGQNGIRFHPMVVRAMGGDKAEGYALEADGKGTFEASFDLDAIAKDLRKQLDDYEAKGHRGATFKFSAKKDQINHANLAVVVFVQDDKTSHVLQAASVDLGTPGGPRGVTEDNRP